jgi:uncharacterized membrane protein YhfC
MSYVLFGLSVILMLAMPLALAKWLARRYRASWGLFGVGVVAFVGSQVAHIPFNLFVESAGWLPDARGGLGNLLIIAGFLGVSAGFFEESARYVVYRWWARDARTWSQGLMLGAGHGGIESILLGFLLAINVAALAGVRAGRFVSLFPGEQLTIVQTQAEALFAGPAILGILPAVERALAIILHLSLSLLVLQMFVRGQRRWWFYAVGWHALVNAVVVTVAARSSVYTSEAVLGILTIASVVIILRLRPQQAPATETDAALPAAPIRLEPLPLTDEKLDDSRYL